MPKIFVPEIIKIVLSLLQVTIDNVRDVFFSVQGV